jgi:thiamine-phosphate pyrophosphorylase
MDARLLAWARAVSRRRNRPPCLPPLWLFTDAHRLPDPRPVVARLPKGLAGVVLRHDTDPERTALGRDLARICRARRLKLIVAGDPRLATALGAGMHLRAGRWPAGAPIPLRRQGTLLTSSAHSGADLRRAARAGADLAFLSPACAGRSWHVAPRSPKRHRATRRSTWWRRPGRCRPNRRRLSRHCMWRRWAGSAARRFGGCRATCAARPVPSRR